MIGILIASAVIGLDTRRTLAYQGFTFFSVLVLISGIWCLFFRASFTARRVLPRFGTAGEPLAYRIIIRSMSREQQRGLYLFEEFGDPSPTLEEFLEIPEPGEDHRNLFDQAFGVYRWRWLVSRKQGPSFRARSLPVLLPRSEGELNVEILPTRRGYLRFTEMSVARPDPFGLLYAIFNIQAPESLLILPKRYALPQISLPGTRRYQSGGVALTSSVGESEEFISMRDYRPGDSLRRIHWKSWAKTGKPVVREYQDEFFVRHALILDTFQDAAYSEVFEEAVSVAASFACTIRTRDSLLDLMFVGPEAYCFTSGRGLSHTDKTLEILASVSACREKPFSVLPPMVFERASVLSGCICILLLWDEERKHFVSQLRGFGMPLLVLVITDKDGDNNYDPGPMKDQPENFHRLEVGKIQEGLSGICET
ncbi:DUF58 domain-containing protein [Desulfococcaceae bacterium HSG8]|nr:DUF58 domain-containing protein [Desulfococcaceae bacterium HSG8]